MKYYVDLINFVYNNCSPISLRTQALLLLSLFTHIVYSTCKLIKKGEGEPSWVRTRLGQLSQLLSLGMRLKNTIHYGCFLKD